MKYTVEYHKQKLYDTMLKIAIAACACQESVYSAIIKLNIDTIHDAIRGAGMSSFLFLLFIENWK